VAGVDDFGQTENMRGIAELDLTGFAATEDDGVWQNAAGVFLRAGFQDSPPMSALDSLLRDAVVGLLVSGATPMEYWIDFPSVRFEEWFTALAAGQDSQSPAGDS